MPYVQGQDRNQIILFPECIDEYISEENPVRIIEEFVEQLDLKELNFEFAEVPSVGRPPYNPKDNIKLYLYGYLNRTRSSRRLEHEAIRNIEVIWLLKKLRPDFKTIADFRKNNKKALKRVFREFVKLCDEWGLFGKEMVAIDGSKFRACNSKRNNFSLKKIDRHIEYIDKKIDEYMAELDENDEVENVDRKISSEEIKKKIQTLHERKESYESKKQKLQSSGENELSTTDPDSRLMSSNNNGVDVSYNVQTTVDSKNKLIVDFKVTNNANDLGELDNMALRAKKVLSVEELIALADKGYYKAEDLKKCVKNGITPYVCKQTYSNATGDREFYSDMFIYDKESNTYTCPEGNILSYSRIRKSKGKIIGYDYKNYGGCANCKFKDRCTKSTKGRIIFRHVDQNFLDKIDSGTKLNISKYKERQIIVEHPFGTVKRSWGAYYFLTRGKSSVTAEVALSYFAYNFRRVINILGITEMMRLLRERKKAVLI